MKELRPTYQLPNEKDVAGSELDTLYETEKKKVKIELAGRKATILQDGWTTNQHNCVIAHSLQVNNQNYFLNALEVGDESKTALKCLELLIKSIEEAETEFGVKVVACITDNCSTMNSMRRQLKIQRPEIIEYGCSSHLLNLIGKKFTPEVLKDKIVKVQKFFRNHDVPGAALSKLKGTRPVLPGDTR